MTQEISVDVAIIGAGTAGLYALREVKRAKKSFILIDRGPLGTTCARVGCMPSKVALHAAGLWQAQKQYASYGISGSENLQLSRDKAWSKVREMRDSFADNAAEGARRSAGEHLLMGHAEFLEKNLLRVRTDGGEKLIRTKTTIIATGSTPVLPSFLQPFAQHCFTTNDLFDLESLPERLGVLGLGPIGLEMGLAMARLGVKVFAADMAKTVAGITDPEVQKIALDRFSKEIEIHLGKAAQLADSSEGGVLLKTASGDIRVDKVLVALGRQPNLQNLNLDKVGIALNERGIPKFNPHTLQIENAPIFIVGDATAHRTLMHEAAHEGAIAGFNAARETATEFQRKIPISIAFTQPDIISVGKRFDEIQNAEILIGSASAQRDGRSRILSEDDGLLRIYASKDAGKILGATMMGHQAEHLAHFLALALENKMSVHQLLQTPFYHPVVEELIQSALLDLAKQLPHSEYPLGCAPLK